MEMNFPFGTTFAAGHQFTTAKFAQQVGTTGGGQVVGLLSSDEQGVTYLRPVDAGNGAFTISLPQASGNNSQHNQQQIMALPINMGGSGKPGEMTQQQPLQIQVVNPADGSGGEKYSIPLTLAHFPQGQGMENLVLGVIDPNTLAASGGIKMITLAYSPAQGGTDGIHLQLQQADENGEVRQDGGDQQEVQHQHQEAQQQHNNNNSSTQTTQGMHCDEMVLPDVKPMLSEGEGSSQAYPVAVVAQITPDMLAVRQEDMEGDKSQKDKDKGGNDDGKVITVQDVNSEAFTAWQSNAAMADYLRNIQSANQNALNISHFLKFSAETIKREQAIESSPLSTANESEEATVDMQQTVAGEEQADPNNPEGGSAPKKKKKYKKKAPKPRRPRPGQVHIATALDGTTLFCCPECNMAYPDKELLEQHLVAHKIERRFICDICGAGLKRKEHLERHKLGHNPERPYICSVCCKGFKRKEHLNLHFVIHSGEKTEVCPECGKGFYRRDHLRKHARSHLAKRVKDELQQVDGRVSHESMIQVTNVMGATQDEDDNTVVLPAAESHSVTLTESHPIALVHHQQH
ncbi:myoneurin-like isoform X1 [Macrosteles quadrilineatus]|uniref:myoneurin-like isoform X1 n=1 Tax=Macrosteles quadrilineatus TaxID=74068 RepID=UPI0023E131E9|nr:myoneurin-like isoform X1 [Macrosteles quadrilineatus]